MELFNLESAMALLVTAKESVNSKAIMQSLIVAAVTASATGYVSAKVLEREVGYLIQEIKRVDLENRETRLKVDEIALRQAGVISQANTIHETQDKRIDKLETRK